MSADNREWPGGAYQPAGSPQVQSSAAPSYGMPPGGPGQPAGYGQPPSPGGQGQPGNPPYAPPAPGHSQPAYGQPAVGQPAYLRANAAPAALDARRQKGQRQLVFGVLWLVGGLAITGFTMASDSPIYLVAWGPMLWGAIQLALGAYNIAKSRTA